MAQHGGTQAYLRTLTRAEGKSDTEAWDEAATLWEEVVATNPVVGGFWGHLADARYHARDYRSAIPAYERALVLGVGYPFTPPAELAYQVARCHALLGEREKALAQLRRALELGYRYPQRAMRDDDLRSLRDDARFRELVGFADVGGMSRDEGWRADLALLAREVKRRGSVPSRVVPEARLDEAVALLSDAIPALTDMQILVELMKLTRAFVGDGHSGLYAPDGHDDLRAALPVRFYLFEEGLFIIAAAPGHEGLLGAQALRIGEHGVDDAMRTLDPLIGRDNEQWLKHAAPNYLRETALLHALGLLPEPDRAALTLCDRDGQERTLTLAARPLAGATTAWRVEPRPADWPFFPETLPTPLPLYLRNTDANYWFEHLPAAGAVYFQFNHVRDDPRELLADFSARLLRFITAQCVERLIIDVRWNGGGNTFLELPLLHGLIGCEQINQPGKLFVVIGRRTFSAAQNGATLLERHTHAIFVGEPTGASPNFIGETDYFELPYSKLQANISDLYWQSSWPMDHRAWIAPRIYTPPTFAAYRENRDLALEAILTYREHLPSG